MGEKRNAEFFRQITGGDDSLSVGLCHYPDDFTVNEHFPQYLVYGVVIFNGLLNFQIAFIKTGRVGAVIHPYHLETEVFRLIDQGDLVQSGTYGNKEL